VPSCFSATTWFAPAEIATYTPPDASGGAIHAVIVEWMDLGSTWRFYAKRTEISGDVEFTLARTDAIRLPLALAILAADAPNWQITSDAPSWTGAAALAASSSPSSRSGKATAAAAA